jgi:glycine betaine catabolism B
MTNFIDRILNHITMYRMVLYYVAGLLAIAFGLGFSGVVPVEPTALAFSVVLITAVCWLTNRLLALLFRVPVNAESVYITALILALLLPPVTATNLMGVAGLALASAVAIASKFLIAVGRKHIFNPVAIGVVASAYLLDQPATWWVGGNLLLLPFVLIGGLLVTRKVQRFDMVGTYILANLAVTAATTSPGMYGEALKQSILYSPLLFAGFAMLTEPLTAAHAKWPRLVYGVIVGALSSPNIHIGDFYLTPEIAFLAGNAFAFTVSPKRRTKFTLLRIEKIAAGCLDFVFRPDRPLAFQPGQYLDWTMSVRGSDDRGNRRPFTIASAPSEDDIRIGVKFYPGASAFKHSLRAMKPGDFIYGSHLAGTFTLPRNPTTKLVFIAGGIGVTPFRSMLSELVETEEIAYGGLLDRAERELGIRTVYAVAESKVSRSNVYPGFIDAALIKREIPDFRDRTYYVSGPRVMVVRFQNILRDLGVSRSRIKVDFFPGFA